jgi:hypothetical protein
LSVPGDVAQMPLAVTVADGRSPGFDGRVVGFGPDQDASTTEAALEALRRHGAAPGRDHGEGWGDGGAGDQAVSAAGLDETAWLLDGALRLLARLPGREQPVDWLGVDDTDTRRLWRALEEYELVPARLTTSRIDGFPWVLVSVRDRRHDTLLARGWGPTAGAGAVAALSAAVATAQVRRSAGNGATLALSPEPGFVHHLHRAHLAALAESVQSWLTTTDRRVWGRRMTADAVAGPIGAWCGMVWLGA